ncbi:MAG: phage holin family protein [Vicinamibacteria bacterium]
MISEGMSAEPRGLLQTLGDLAATLVAMAHTRLDLLSNDLEEDREHLLSLTITALGALFLLGVGVVLSALLLVVLFWDAHRILVLGLLAVAFLAAGVLAAVRVARLARTKPRLFASSLSELFKDRQQLESRL